MTGHERDFKSFHLGDNVYALADGLIPEIADRLDVQLSDEPNSSDLQAIMEKVGPNKVLRDNQEIEAISRIEMAALVERSGVQKILSRSLWTPEAPATKDTLDYIVIVGGVANWQDRTARHLIHRTDGRPVYSLAGTRPMETATEKPNPNIMDLHNVFGRYPTEAEYAASIIVPKLVVTGRKVMASSFESSDGDEMFAKFFEQNPHLLEKRLAVARVANAGLIMALQLRDAARKLSPDFDTDSANPQTFVITDEFPVAKTEEQDNRPQQYQKAATALRQVVLTAKKLHEATN